MDKTINLYKKLFIKKNTLINYTMKMKNLLNVILIYFCILTLESYYINVLSIKKDYYLYSASTDDEKNIRYR